MELEILTDVLNRVSEDSLRESQRLLHGRGRCYTGFEQITIDWFQPVLFITQFKEQEGFDIEVLCKFLVGYFDDRFPRTCVETIVYQNRALKTAESNIVYGKLPAECIAIEKSLKFNIDLMNFKNIGFFLDARNARQALGNFCEHKNVLNLFAFTCTFSVVALANNAKSVVNLDMGRGVLERGRLNHELNKLNSDGRSVTYIKSDVFKAWKKLHKYGRYDIIVIDPPSFQKGSFNAEKDYEKIIKNLHRLLEKDAKIIACLNSPFLNESFLDERFLNGPLNEGEYQIEKIERVQNPAAFCDVDSDAGLKVIVYQFNRAAIP